MRRTPASESGADTLRDETGDEAGPEPVSLSFLFRPETPQRGHAIALGNDAVRIGRQVDRDRDLRLGDPGASKHHAEVAWSPIRQGYWLRDLQSSNGTFLNGRKVASELLTPGDVIRIGDTVLEFGPSDLEAAGWEPAPGSPFVGRSRGLRRTLAEVAALARSRAAVLIVGETGTGKELAAGALHRASQRRGPLCALNCAALPNELVESELFGHEKGAFSGANVSRAGLFRAAQDGTLFLDEIGELALPVQAKLLRALEASAVRPVGATDEVPVDVRVVAATNRDLASEVEQGRFRADLYARLAESVIAIDPLRERRQDIEPLWQHFVDMLGEGVVIDVKGSAFEAMVLHRWPYNVREMRQLVRKALLLKPQGGTLMPADLPAAMLPSAAEPAGSTGSSELADGGASSGEPPSAQRLRQLVEEFRGNVKEVASFLGKDRTQVYRWLKRYGIDPGAYRAIQ